MKKKGFEKLVFFFLLVVGRILLTIKKLAQLLTSPLFFPFCSLNVTDVKQSAIQMPW